MATIPHSRSGLFTVFENEEDEKRYYNSATSFSSITKCGVPWSSLDVPPAEPIACTGSGIIFKGRYGTTPVVLKVMQSSQLKTQKCFKKLLGLDHPNIVRFYGICIDDNLISSKHVSLIISYCSKGDLMRKIAHNRPLKRSNFLKWMQQTADGMAYLHRQCIAHRNLKPQKLLLDEEQNVRISGFALCKELKGANGDTFCGTALYMAPEIAAGCKHSIKVDVWSYGVVLREMLTQVHPYAPRNTVSIVLELGDIGTKKRWPDTFPLLPPSDCPTKLAELIRQCLAANYHERPSFDDILNMTKEIEDEISKIDDDEWNSKKKSWRSMARREKRKSVG
uniref:Mitogen-activated protein kinase kinase kinase dlk-1 n=1 Tax=Ascaris suum TaxID=6253 RepID=F1L7Z8_ASCSU